ncbi:MAG: hypothetical protein QM809_02505 [Gordonia sp. (in: high G+C Gram-positive bacteria)]|uniref:hypothetical protein n=1 Tax=Gordonia sp. (in: high G+C Gram-positive bacteria) TaxID=84139 RepID=UPI0039E4FD9F
MGETEWQKRRRAIGRVPNWMVFFGVAIGVLFVIMALAELADDEVRHASLDLAVALMMFSVMWILFFVRRNPLMRRVRRRPIVEGTETPLLLYGNGLMAFAPLLTAAIWVCAAGAPLFGWWSKGVMFSGLLVIIVLAVIAIVERSVVVEVTDDRLVQRVSYYGIAVCTREIDRPDSAWMESIPMLHVTGAATQTWMFRGRPRETTAIGEIILGLGALPEDVGAEFLAEVERRLGVEIEYRETSSSTR